MNGNFQIKKREIRKVSRDLVFPSILVHSRTITFLYLKMSPEALISWKKCIQFISFMWPVNTKYINFILICEHIYYTSFWPTYNFRPNLTHDKFFTRANPHQHFIKNSTSHSSHTNFWLTPEGTY